MRGQVDSRSSRGKNQVRKIICYTVQDSRCTIKTYPQKSAAAITRPLNGLLDSLPRLTNCLQYLLPCNVFTQADYIKGGTAKRRFRHNRKHIAFTTTDDNFLLLGFLKNICQLFPCLRVSVYLHSLLHHLYCQTFCNITHTVIKANER